MPIDKLNSRILVLLEEQGKTRFSAITSALWKDPENQRFYIPAASHQNVLPAFKVLVYKRLRKLTEEDLIQRLEESHKNVSYRLTRKGRSTLKRFYLEELKSGMSVIAVQALETLSMFYIRHVCIMNSEKSEPEDYAIMFKDMVNRDNFIDQFKALLRNPEPLKEFSEYLQRYIMNKIVLQDPDPKDLADKMDFKDELRALVKELKSQGFLKHLA